MNKPNGTNDANYALRIDKDLKKELEAEAKKEGRSLNGYINYILANRGK